jgi:hypothetical protein
MPSVGTASSRRSRGRTGCARRAATASSSTCWSARAAGGLVLDDELAGGIRRVRYRDLSIPVPGPEDLLLIACLSAQDETPNHWFTAARFVRNAELDWDRLADRAGRLAPLRVASLLLYCRSEGVEVPDGILKSVLPS